jgi:hypothetical protein
MNGRKFEIYPAQMYQNQIFKRYRKKQSACEMA